MSNIKKSIVVCLLTAVLLVSITGMASATTVTFYLDSATDAASGQHIMWKDDSSNCSGSVAITDTGSGIWTANEPASYDVGFSESETWGGRIVRTTTSGDQKFTVCVGYYDGTSFYSSGNSGEVTISDGDWYNGFSVTTSAFTVPGGKWLALEVTSSTGVTVNYLSTDNFGSYRSGISFQTPPDYPFPELNTLVLLSVGLLTLVGYVAYRRRNTKK
ncbi:MAG: hypothetical protein GWP10_20980 [Nitrospiraceae bacterium]|nr:hypothetical protein [Nitrospiraceae bacterium]